jgi:hypothetical protein
MTYDLGTERVRSKVRTRILALCSVYMVAPNEYTTTPPRTIQESPGVGEVINENFALWFVIGFLVFFVSFVILLMALDFWLEWI